MRGEREEFLVVSNEPSLPCVSPAKPPLPPVIPAKRPLARRPARSRAHALRRCGTSTTKPPFHTAPATFARSWLCASLRPGRRLLLLSLVIPARQPRPRAGGARAGSRKPRRSMPLWFIPFLDPGSALRAVRDDGEVWIPDSPLRGLPDDQRYGFRIRAVHRPECSEGESIRVSGP